MKKSALCLAMFLIAVICVTVLTACVPSSYEAALEKFKPMTAWHVHEFESEEADVVGAFEASGFGSTGEQQMMVYYFNTTDAAKKFCDSKQYKKKEGLIVKRSGKCVYYGTAEIVGAFEK